MDPASLTIGIIGLSTVLVTTVKKIQETVQDLKWAQRDLCDVYKEVDLFAGICDDFLDACDDDPSITKQASKIKLQLKSWTKRTLRGFKNLLGKVRAVARDPKYDYSAIEVVTAHVIWLRSKRTMQYLRASLSVARQNMICFTNIRVISKLNVELAHLKSVLSLTEAERRLVEVRHKMTVEERIVMIQQKIRKRRAQRRKIKGDLKEAIKEVTLHEETIKDSDFVPQTKTLLRFGNSVNQYVNDVVVQERIDRSTRRSNRGSSLPSSQSTATTPTRSTQSSHNQTSAPESPPTSPEPTHVDLPSEPRIDEEATTSILNYCERCSGTCINTVAHNTSVQHVPSEATSHTSMVVPPVASVAPLKPASNRRRACSCPQSRRARLSSQSPTPPSNPRRDNRNYPAEPSIHPAINEEEEGNNSDGTSEEEYPRHEQAREAGPSIWQATGAFGGHEPRGLRQLRRQRNGSP